MLLAPVLLGCQTKNAKIIACAIACLQRLVGIRGAVAPETVPQIIATLRSVLSQGVEIQVRRLSHDRADDASSRSCRRSSGC